MITTLISLLVRALGYAKYFDQIITWVVENDTKFEKGADTFEEILRLMKAEKIAAKLDWAKPTILQLCYAYARIKGLIKRP